MPSQEVYLLTYMLILMAEIAILEPFVASQGAVNIEYIINLKQSTLF